MYSLMRDHYRRDHQGHRGCISRCSRRARWLICST